jgi:hypothetical protein
LLELYLSKHFCKLRREVCHCLCANGDGDGCCVQCSAAVHG